MRNMSLTWFYHVSQQDSTHVYGRGIVPIEIDVHTKKYFEHLKHSWKNENDEERGRKEKERSIQNKCNQCVHTVRT